MTIPLDDFIPAPAKGARRRHLGWVGVLLAGLGLTVLVAVLARPKVDPDKLWNEALRDFETRQFEQAEIKLEQLADLRQPSGLDWMLRGEVAIAKNRIDEALADLERVPDS